MSLNMDGSTRRDFLRQVAIAGASGSLLAACARGASVSTGAGSAGVRPSANRIGVQLYTVRDQLQKDFEGTLERVAQIGYRQIEFAGYYDRTPAQVRTVLDGLGLTSPSAHVGVPLLRQDAAAQIAAARTIGQTYITVPSYPFANDTGGDAFKAAAADFNRWGAACKAAGLRLAFHNHDSEFRDFGGMTGMDILMRETDPALVDFELDLYWATFAGQDPVALFDRYPGRITMWHVKDMVESQSRKTMTAVGQGTIDFARIFARAPQSGLRYFFVEHDSAASYPGGSLASLEASAQHLRRLLPA